MPLYKIRYQLLLAVSMLCLQAKAQLTADFSATPTTGCVPLKVQFTDKSLGNPDRWLWDLGEGTISTEKDPAKLYLTPGLYTITLTVFKGAQSATVTKTAYINVSAIPTVNFSATPLSGCSPLDVQFTDNSSTSTGTITTWNWDFGDGNLGTGKNPLHLYQTPGTFKVTLSVTTSEGCTKSFSIDNYINIKQLLKADFDLQYTPACVPNVTVKFKDKSIGTNITSWFWEFGDGNTSSSQNPTYTYTTVGAFDVKLTVTNLDGCKHTYTMPGAVNVANLRADFSLPSLACANAASVYVGKSTPSPQVDSTIWTISDGTTYRVQDLVKAFPNPGIYNITQTVFQYGCSSSITKSIEVKPRPTASFSSSTSIACKAPLTVNFQNTSSNGKVVKWDFGNGKTSIDENPAITFDTLGIYSVTLVVSNSLGCLDTLRKVALVKVLPPQLDSIIGLPYDGCGPYTANLQPKITSSEPVVSYNWNFGDGGTSTLQNPTHTFSGTGTYTVTLTVSTTSGCQNTFQRKVVISPKPKADFTGSPLLVCPSIPTVFKDQSTGTITRWFWAFGDGSTSTAQNPQHKYNDTGFMDVKLIVYNNGCADTLVRKKYVYVDPPIARFIDSTTCADQFTHYFTNQAIGATTWVWNFGDGNTSTTKDPVHTYADTGTYKVSLFVSDGVCNHTTDMDVYVLRQKAAIQPVYVAGCTSATAELTAIGPSTFPSRIKGYEWTFQGSPPVKTDTNFITRFFPDTTTITVKLKITDINGCEDSSFLPVKIELPASKPNFSPAVQFICVNTLATFADSSKTFPTNPVVKWTWFFDNIGDPGNDTVMTAPPFQFKYLRGGIYDVKLITEDKFGCIDSLEKKSAVRVFEPDARFTTKDTMVCLNTPVVFENFSSNAPGAVQFKWSFGDGRTSDKDQPTISYSKAGRYDIQLVLIDPYGCPDTLLRPGYVVAADAKADFMMSDSFTTCPPFLVQFTNKSASNFVNLWDFGNGNFSSLINPAHTFTKSGDFTVKLKILGNGGCADSVSKKVLIRGPQGIIRYTPLENCAPMSVQFNSTAVNTKNYVWDFSDGITRITSDSFVTHTYQGPGRYLPRVILEDGKGCQIPILGSDTIIVNDTPVVVAGPNPIVCLGQSVTLQATGGISYRWDAHSTLSCTNCNSPLATPAVPTVYRVTATDAKGCVGTDTALVRVMLPGQLSVGLGDTLCVGESIQLVAGGFARYSWSPTTGLSNPNIPNPIARPTTTTNYVVTATDTLNCFTSTATVPVTVYPIPKIDIVETVIKANVGVVLPLKSVASADVSKYLWTPATGLSCTTCKEPLVTVQTKISYTAQVSNDAGCVASDQLRIEPTCTGESIFVPNTFSPNADGNNDLFYPRGSGVSRIKYLQIFNRWGELVFERKDFVLNDPTAAWDGTFRGQKLTPDVFVYVMEVICGNNQTFMKKGNVTLLQ